LQSYAQWRRRDHYKMIAFTDGLARVFANPLAPLRALRNAGLLAVDVVPPLKHLLTRHTMGLAGKLPRLARGLPLARSSGDSAATNPPHPNGSVPLDTLSPKGEGEQVKRG
jgi:2-octaprenyl-6-methoxyphenol hydroxylase